MGIKFDKELYDLVYPYVKDKLIFDVGANRGEVTKKFIDNGAKVLAIEPQKEVSVGDNFKGVLAIENVCLSDRVGEITFYKGDKKHTTISTCLNEWRRNHPSTKWTKVKMKTNTLDNLIEKYEIPTYIKIDVEGHDDKVLNGLSKKIDFISFEFTQGFSESFYNSMKHIQKLGFKELTTFIKKKIKKTIDGKRRTVRAYKIMDNFMTIDSVLKFFDKLDKGVQGDILIRS